MAPATDRHSPPLRATVVGCGLFCLLASHVFVRYLFTWLFGTVTYQGLSPLVPWLVLGAFGVVLVGLAVGATRQGGASGLALASGLVLFAAEPFTDFGGGCEVGSATGQGVALPGVSVEGLTVLVSTPGGACQFYLNVVTLGLGSLLVAGGLLGTSLPDSAITRATTAVESVRAMATE
jgi:hypothetical protein